MKEFTLKLDNIEWEVTSNNSDSVSQNWICRAAFNGFAVSINIPIDQKMTRAKVMLYVEHVHVAMQEAWKAQDIHQYFQNNRK